MLQWQGVLFLPVQPRSEGAPLWWLNHFLGSANYFGQKLIWSSWLSRLAISFANMAGKCKCRSMNSSCRDVLPRCPLHPHSLGSSIIRLFVLCLHFVIAYIAEIIVISTRKSHLAHVTPFSGLNCFAWFFFSELHKNRAEKGSCHSRCYSKSCAFRILSNRGNICTCICSQYYTLAEIFA